LANAANVSPTISNFSFASGENNLSQTYVGTITQNNININVPYGKGILSSSTNSNYPNDPFNIDTLKGIVWKTCEESLTGSTCTGGTFQQVGHAVGTNLCIASMEILHLYLVWWKNLEISQYQ